MKRLRESLARWAQQCDLRASRRETWPVRCRLLSSYGSCARFCPFPGNGSYTLAMRSYCTLKHRLYVLGRAEGDQPSLAVEETCIRCQ